MTIALQPTEAPVSVSQASLLQPAGTSLGLAVSELTGSATGPRYACAPLSAHLPLALTPPTGTAAGGTGLPLPRLNLRLTRVGRSDRVSTPSRA